MLACKRVLESRLISAPSAAALWHAWLCEASRRSSAHSVPGHSESEEG